MNLEEITNVINDIYKKPLHEKKRHIVFWYDEDSEFINDIDILNLENIRILKLNENNYFYIRYELEKVDTESNILIYANMKKPNPRENWLLDIYKYSTEFSTDKTTVLMRDLNINDESLKPLFKYYSKFFNNKERYLLFKKYNIEEYTEEIVHIAVLSALCKLSTPDFEEVTKIILKEALTKEKKQIDTIKKFGDMEAFWDLASRKYGYNLEEKTPGKLMILLTLTDFSDKVNRELPNNYKRYISNKKSDCIVFINHFMNDREYSQYYDNLVDKVQEIINLDKVVSKWDIYDFIECDTFRFFDEYIIKKLVDIIKSEASEYDEYLNIIHSRKSLYWYKEYKYYYDALEHAIELFRIKYEIENIRQKKLIDMIESYYKDEKNSYYLIDKAYRKFYVAYDKVKDTDILHTLMEKIESIYTNWYLDELAVKWSSSIKDELENSWRIGGILPQRMFYSSFVEPHIIKNEKVFVIISDALRYDCAKELTDILNMERKGIATIDVLQGVLPSYTKLGMASLLPNKSISIDDKNNVYVDGISASGINNRDKILKSKNADSIAVSYNDIKDISATDFRNIFSGKKVIYIYHNVIDARGDNASTEREVFDAVEDTFIELNQLVGYIVSRANGSNIYITSDHGFLYKRGNLDTTNKIKYNSDNSYGKRYAITDGYNEKPGTLTFSMDYILENDTNKYVTVPRGEIRFAKQGAGNNYVHGGAMPQEIIIPVIKFKNSRGVGKVDEKVEIEMTTISRKITTSRFTINFFQKDKVEEKKLPLILRAYFEDSNGNIISNENKIFGDSKSSNTEDRIYKEKFILNSINYDKNAKYYLVLLEDNKAKDEYLRYEFIIDIAIQDEFEFKFK